MIVSQVSYGEGGEARDGGLFGEFSDIGIGCGSPVEGFGQCGCWVFVELDKISSDSYG